MKTDVTFKSNGLQIAGHLYIPDQAKGGEPLAAVVVGHPFGGVKEQTAGTYAKALSDQGFVTLAFDAACQGASEGEPRGLEDPFVRAENVKAAVGYLGSLPQVDPARIGALGICASGGYVPFAAQTDLRIKAVAGLCAVDTGLLFTEGLRGSFAVTPEGLRTALEQAGQDRTGEAAGHPPRMLPIVADAADQIPASIPEGTLFREGTDYYRTPRAQHRRSTNRYVARSVDALAAFTPYAQLDRLAPRPLLMVVGGRADTAYFSEIAIGKARGPKELFVVAGATHVDLYDKASFVEQAARKLAVFFHDHLGGDR